MESYTKHELASAGSRVSPKSHRRKHACESCVKTAHFVTPDCSQDHAGTGRPGTRRGHMGALDGVSRPSRLQHHGPSTSGRMVQREHARGGHSWTGCPGHPGSQHQRGKCSKGRKSRPTCEQIVRIARLETRNCTQEHPKRHPGRIARRPRRPSGGVYIAIQNIAIRCC